MSSPLVASAQATPSGLTFDDMVEDAPAVPAHPDAESVAAKLQRIRAVVGKAPVKAEDADFAEDLPAQDMPDVADAHDDIVEPESQTLSNQQQTTPLISTKTSLKTQ